MINVNATLLVQIINFLILMFILNRILLKPITEIIERRSKKIEDEKKRLVNLQQEAKELVEKCESIERKARKEASEQSNILKKEASEKAEDIFNRAKEEINSIREEADREINSKIEEASLSLKIFASELADELTEKVIGRRFAG
ncbi:MAG: ATP synthase F0 subunit B [Deltaproteobacteria bacterium]|nr:ATP synthase F0 subunit B [Deltaproteobacteria bacterium]